MDSDDLVRTILFLVVAFMLAVTILEAWGGFSNPGISALTGLPR